MAKKKVLLGPSNLAKILAKLNAEPKFELSSLKTLKLTLAYEGELRGTKEFAKEHLPRIQWANPNLRIQVENVKTTEDKKWKPEMQLQFQDGQQRTLSLKSKWAPSIVKELMDVAGGSPWQQYKAEAQAAGRPLLPGDEEQPADSASRSTPASLGNPAASARGSRPSNAAKASPPPPLSSSRPSTGADASLS